MLDIDLNTLVQECRNGDRDAMSILYTRFAPRMLRVISRYVSDKDSAQDILHDGFVAAFTRLDTLRDPERLDFWLATIMKNLSLKFLHAQSVSSILEEIPDSDEETDPIEALDFTTLESLIRQLPEGYQKVFRLAVLEGKTHKEISEILGIAPNSSSSQLFHAKLRLRQLIRDYQIRAGLISLILLLVSVGIIFFGRHAFTTSYNLKAEATPQHQYSQPLLESEPTGTEPSKPSRTVNAFNPRNLFVSAAKASVPNHRTITASEVAETDLPFEEPSITPEVVDSVVLSSSEGTPIITTDTLYQSDLYNTDDLFFAEGAIFDKRNLSWSTGISVDPGLAAFDRFGFSNDDLSVSMTPIRPPQDIEPDGDPDETEPSPKARIPKTKSFTSSEDYLSSFSHRHYLPISFAITAEKQFSSLIGIESGVGYSYLHSDYEGFKATATCHWHYLEIPLKVNLYAYSSPRFRLYGSLGWRVAIPVYSYASLSANPYCQSGRFDSKAVWSVGGSVGAAFRLSKRVDIFIEPSLRYHFPQDCALPNIWTDDESWTLSLPIGFRLSW